MRSSSLIRWVTTAATVGLVVSTVLLAVEKFLSNHVELDQQFGYAVSRVMQITWPSSFWLMATDGIEGTQRAHLFVGISVAANIILYALLGTVAWSLAKFVKRIY